MKRFYRLIDSPLYLVSLRNLALLASGYLLGMWSTVAQLSH